MKIFGDDGFRDIFGTGLMSQKFLNTFFFRLNLFLKKKKIKKVTIGYDTRESYKKILSILVSKIRYSKIDILDEPVTTPCVSFLSIKNKKDFFIMITASHFERNFNGFKFFYRGEKLKKKYEKEIINCRTNSKLMYQKKNKIRYSKKHILYKNFINSKFAKIKLNKKVLIDFAYGSAAPLAKKLHIFKNVVSINTNYNFKNINLNCGSNKFLKTIKKKINKKYDYIFSFDGDADRVVFYKKGYGPLEVEKIAYIFATLNNNNSNKNVVSTIIVNPGLKKILATKNISLFKTKVGDRNVISLQKKKNSKLGFETTGHFSFFNYMDGIYAASSLLKIISQNENELLDCLNNDLEFKLFKMNVKDKNKLLKLKKFAKKNCKFKSIVRKSIWEKVYRVYIFYKEEDKKKFLVFKNHLIKSLK